MSLDEALIYSHIEESGRDGIWTKILHTRTNLHHNVISRCLKALEAQRYVKQVKSVKNPTRKIFMLASIEPSLEMSGGPWFTDSEIDTEFIDNVMNVIWRYTASLSFPNAFKGGPNSSSTKPQESFAARYSGYPTVADIHKFVGESGITNVELALVDVRALCEVLVYDGKFERINNGYAYKATWSSVVAQGGAPSLLIVADDDDGDGDGDDSEVEVLVDDAKNGLSQTQTVDCMFYEDWLEPRELN